MLGYLKRLATTGAAYQAADLLSRLFAVATLPLYTRHLRPGAYGVAETIVTFVVLLSIPLRLGLGEAFVRYWYLDDDDERRLRLSRTTTGSVAVLTTLAGIVAGVFAAPLSRVLLGYRDPVVLGFGILGLWAFTNLEVVKALLRVEERWRAFMAVTIGNVVVTVALTIYLVVVRGDGAHGLVAGNFVASGLVLVAAWFALRGRLGLIPSAGSLRALLRFGLPTVPADASLYALNVLDRAYLLRVDSARAAGLYALSVKLSSAVIVAVRGFQYAWPPLAYSVGDDEEARRLYALVVTWFLALCGVVVAALTLLGRWIVRLLATPAFFAAHQALPWLALGWMLYGLVLVYVVIVGRLRMTSRNVPATLAGLAVNGALLVALVGPLGIAGAGIALVGSYVVMLVVLHALTRRRFPVAFEWGRLARLLAVLGAPTVAGELLLPTSGLVGLGARLALTLALPLVLLASGFLSVEEREWAKRGLARLRERAGMSRRTPAVAPDSTDSVTNR